MEENPKLQVFYESLVKSKYAVPDYATFEETLKNPVKSKEFYDALKTANYELPEFETFVSDLGLKKKDASDYGLPTKQVFADMFSTVSKEKPEVSERPADPIDPEKYKVPAPDMKEPTFSYPGGPFANLFAQSMKRNIDEETFKQHAQERIGEIDKKLEAYPKAKMQVVDVAYGADTPPQTKEEVEKQGLIEEKESLKQLLTTPTKLQYVLGKAYKQSIVGLTNQILTGYDIAPEEWMSKYDASTMTDVAATALGFLVDSPAFSAFGAPGKALGDKVAKPLVRNLMNKGVEKFVKAGVSREIAEKLVLQGASKLAYTIPGALSSGTALGGYGSTIQALSDWADPEKDFKDIDWGQVLSRGMKDFSLGVGVGTLGLGTAAVAKKAQAIPNMAGRVATQAGVQAGGLTAESALFVGGGALLEGRKLKDITKDEFLETVALLGTLKLSHAVQKPGETVKNIRKSVSFDSGKPGEGQFEVDIQPWELGLLDFHLEGKHDYKTTMEILKDSDGWMADVLKDETIPAYLKAKLLWGARGVAMDKAGFTVDKVETEGEYVNLYNKEGVLIDKRKYDSTAEADQGTIELGLQLEDNKMQARSAEPDVDKVKIITDLKNKGTDIPALLEAVDKPVVERTPEEGKKVGDYYSMIPKPKEEKKPEGGGEEKPTRETDKTLSLGDKSFADKDELMRHLEDVAINKETGELDKAWFDREINAWPNMETVKVINEWTEAKKVEIKAKQEAKEKAELEAQKKAEPKKPKAPEVPIETGVKKAPQKEFDKNGLIDEVRKYSDMSASQKKKNVMMANTIRVNAQRLGYELKEGDVWKVGVTKDGKFLAIKKDPAKVDKAKIEGQKLLNEYDQDFQDYVNDVLDTNPDLFGVLIKGLTNAQRAQAFRDIKAGKKSTASAVALNALDFMYKTHGGIDVWNAEAEESVGVSREEIKKAKDELISRGREELDNYSYQDADVLLKKGLITKLEYDEITDYIERTEEESRRAEEDFDADISGNDKGGTEKGEAESKVVNAQFEKIKSLTKGKKPVSKKEGESNTVKMLIQTAVDELGFTKEEHGEEYWNNASMYVDYLRKRTGMEDDYDVGDPELYLSGLREASVILDAIDKNPSISIEAMAGKTISETIDLLKKQLPKYKGEDLDVINMRIQFLEDYGDFIQEVIDNKIKPNEEPVSKPNPPDSKGEENIVPGGTEGVSKPVEAKGEGKPVRTTDVGKQKQIDAIDKDYDARIADAQKELAGMTEEKRNKVIRDAGAEVDRRNTVFGDADAIKDGVIKPEDQGFKVSNKPVEEATRKFDERKVELTKQVDALNKERESKIGEVLKQSTFDWEGMFKEETPEEKAISDAKIKEQENAKLEEEYQKSSFDKKWAPTREVAISKLKQTIADAEARIADWSSRVYKKSGGKTVEVGKDNDFDLKNVDVDRVNEKRRQQVIKGAQDEITEARKDLKALGLSETDINNLITKKSANEKTEKSVEQSSSEDMAMGNRTSVQENGKKVGKRETKGDSVSLLNDAVSKYGWSAVKNPEGFWLLNPKGKPTVKVVIKKGTYKFLDMAENKLMDGRGQLEKSAEKLLKDYYYAKEKPIETSLATQLGVPTEEVNVLSMLQESKVLTPDEKKVLYRQYKRGVMNEFDISKYTTINIEDIQSGRIDKWGKVILEKLKGKKFDAEDVTFEEVKPEVKKEPEKPKLTFIRKVKVNEDVRLTKDQRYKVDQHIVEYRDEKGEEYRKSFNVKHGDEPTIPESGTHDELNALKDQHLLKPEAPSRELPTTKDQIQVTRGGRTWKDYPLHVYPDGRVDIDHFGRKTINPEEYTIVGKEIPKVETTPELKIEGIKFKDKNYTDIEQVQDDLADGKITFDESKALMEDVRKFEDNLKKEAGDNASRMIDKFDNDIKDSENRLNKNVDDQNKLFMRILPPDIISQGNTALWKQLVKARDGVANWMAGKLQAGMASQVDALRWTSNVVNNWYGGLSRTERDIMGKLKMTGTVREFAPLEAQQIRDKLLAVVNSDPESLRRVRDALDPEIATERLVYGDLSVTEKNLYMQLRDLNTWVHETNYANGFIPTETYLKFKDVTGDSKYIARMYDKYETMPEEISEFIKQGNNAIKSKIIADIYKAREEVDDWKKEHAITDPTYLTAKRVMQTIQNVAVKNYMEQVQKDHPDMIKQIKKGEEVPKGYTKLSSSFKWGPFRNRAVANHIVEDFTGFFFANEVMNVTYDAMKLFDRTGLNQFYKKFRTVYNPFVQTGNFTGNLFFSSIAGINPAQLVANMPEAIKDSNAKTAEYKSLLKSGILGRTGITGDMKPIDVFDANPNPGTVQAEGFLDKARGLFEKADEAATKLYQGSDNVAKYAAYKVFRKQGLSHEQSVRRVYDAFQNYSTVGKIWDVASKTPILGNKFVKFQADLQRILLNGVTTSPLTTVGTLMLISAAGKMVSALSGETEEEQKIRESRKGVAKIPLPFGMSVPLSFKIGKSEFNVARYLAPLYVYKYEDSDADLAELSKFMPFQFQKIDRPALNETGYVPAFSDPTYGFIASIMADRDFRGISIQNPKASKYHNPNPTTEERIANVMNYVGRTQIPFYRSAQDMYDGITGNLDYYGRKRDWKQAILNNIIKVQEFDKPELKSYVERNIDYLTNRFVSLSARMGDSNSAFFKAVKNAEDKGLPPEMIAKIYESQDKVREKRLQKSLDEQVTVMQELERITGVYKKWYPDDPFIEENFANIQQGKNQRFNVMDDIDLQKKYKDEYNVLKSNNILKRPQVPVYMSGKELTEDQRKQYLNTYWSEYLRHLDMTVGLTEEEMEDEKNFVVKTEPSETSPKPKKRTLLEVKASDAASYAKKMADGQLRTTIK